MIHSCEAPLKVILQKPWLWQDLVPWTFGETRAKRSMRWSCLKKCQQKDGDLTQKNPGIMGFPMGREWGIDSCPNVI